MPDQAPARLEEPLLETRQRPTLNGRGQHEPSQQIAKIVGDHPEEQPDLVGPEAVAREARPMGGFLALLLNPLLGRPALIVEADDGSVRPGQTTARFVPVKGGHDEGHPREEFPEVVLDLGDHPPRSVPRRGLILEASIPDQRSVTRPTPGSDEYILDAPLQDIV